MPSSSTTAKCSVTPADPAAMARLAGEAGLRWRTASHAVLALREDYDRGDVRRPALLGAPGRRRRGGRGRRAGRAASSHEDVAMLDRPRRRHGRSWVSRRDRAAARRSALLSNMVPEIGARLKQSFTLLSRFAHLTLLVRGGQRRSPSRRSIATCSRGSASRSPTCRACRHRRSSRRISIDHRLPRAIGMRRRVPSFRAVRRH